MNPNIYSAAIERGAAAGTEKAVAAAAAAIHKTLAKELIVHIRPTEESKALIRDLETKASIVLGAYGRP